MPARFREAAAGGDVLPAIEVQPFQNDGIVDFIWGGDLVDDGGDVVARLILVEPAAREVDDFAEEVRIVLSRDAERFQVACARGLHMKLAVGDAREHRVHRKLVAAAVQRDLVGAEAACDFGVDAHRCFELREVALVVDPLLEIADKSGSHAD